MAVRDKSEHPRGEPPPPPPPSNRYLDWAIKTGFRYQRPGDWIPLLVEFRREAVVQGEEASVNAFKRFQELGWLGEAWRVFVKIPEILQTLPKALNDHSNEFDFCVVLVNRKEALGVVEDAGWRKTIRSAQLGPPLADLGKASPLVSIGAEPASNRSPAGPGAPPIDETQSTPPLSFMRKLARFFGLARRQARQRRGAGLAQETGQSSGTGPAQVAAGAKRVVVAVLDEGIAFAHERFRSGDGSRIEFLWKQDGRYGKSLGSWMPGTELTGQDIKDAITHFSVAGRVDEDRLYQREGDVDFGRDGFKALARRRSHGTHVLDLAAGAQRDAAGIEARPIIAVELPQESVADPTGAPLYIHILLGIVYILSRAEAMLQPQETELPVVVNLSYGPHHGPHDGTSSFERILDFFIDITQNTSTPLHVVLAAGNFRQLRTHARVSQLAPSHKHDLVWILQPEDKTPSFLELWARASGNAPAELAVSVTSPGGATWTVNKAVTSDPPGTAAPRELQVDYIAEPSHVLVSIVAQPTAAEPLDPLGLPLAPSGRWTITVQNTGAGPLELDSWIGRDVAIGGRRSRGRQSYFEDSSYERNDREGRPVEFDPAPAPPGRLGIERSRTLSGIATGDNVHVVGGFRRRPGLPDMPASYSSMGPASRPATSRNAVTALAPSDDSLNCPGLLGSGTHSGSIVAMYGTSVAAPVYARALANQIGLKATMAFDPPPAPPRRPFVPPGSVKDVAGKGCLRETPYHDSSIREEQRPGRTR
jgi:hypothetical protein